MLLARIPRMDRRGIVFGSSSVLFLIARWSACGWSVQGNCRVLPTSQLTKSLGNSATPDSMNSRAGFRNRFGMSCGEWKGEAEGIRPVALARMTGPPVEEEVARPIKKYPFETATTVPKPLKDNASL